MTLLRSYFLALGLVTSIGTAVGIGYGIAATVQDPDRPGLLGTDGQILGDRDEVRLVAWPPTDGDDEPLYAVMHSTTVVGFARDGDQCTNGKLGIEIVPCEGELVRALASTIPAPMATPVALTNDALPDWAGTPLPVIIEGNTIYVTVPAPAPLLPQPPAAVPLPGAGPLLFGALLTLLIAFIARRHSA
ncbi:hypothetical protein D2T29_00395 [Sinirhodobacter populi]|uniref:Uncharacterized protein n=1 Tax=Paenirhodobacter populi TaxID=2306993 RepID=A0A443KPX0_9RHOB|nr:hypothetical protein [Sinirhodobacter populi]RWR34970.1 hypothetical protein D2T29_00395 [Sinirhodobacter populi]